MAKKKILTFIDWYLPGYKAGGPIRSLANIVETFQDEYEYYIVTRNTDLADDTPYEGITPDTWLSIYSAQIYYITASSFSFQKIKQLIAERDYDMLYLNSLFSFRYSLIPLLIKKLYFKNLPTVFAPRGMLGEGALKSKRLKKRFFLAATRLTGFFNGLIWHATTEEEQKHIEQHYGADREIRIGQCLTLPKVLKRDLKAQKNSGELKAFYIGRMSRHKNISFALEQFEKMPLRGTLSLDIYGALEEEDYYENCKLIIDKLGDRIRVTYHGPVPYDELKQKIISDYHFMILPSKGESYSHAILDSWGCGCPVLISDQTPWLNLEQQHLGWNYKLNESGEFEQQLQKAMDMNHETYLNWAATCVDFVNQELCKDEIIDNNRTVFA